jgi:hypothetical protein
MKLRSTTDKHGSSKERAPADDFVILSSEECVSIPTLEQKNIFAQLEADLLTQLKARIKYVHVTLIHNNIWCFTIDVLR